jgi:hypothetical protein
MKAGFAAAQYERDAAAWKAEHAKAMEYLDVQDKLAAGLRLFRFIRGADDSWSREVEAGREKLAIRN